VYLARFESPSGEILQAAVCLQLSAGAEAAQRDLSEVLHSRLTAEGGLSFAVRTQIADGRIDRLLLLSYPTKAKASLEALVQELCDPLGTAAHPCASRNQHDELAGGFPAIRQAWMRPGSYRAGEYLLASDFRLFSIIEPLFLIAVDQGWTLAYQINVLRQSAAREDFRWLKKQLVRMELQEAFPGALYDLQRSIVDRLPETAYLLDEMVGCGNEQSWDYLTRVVDEEFALRMKRYGFSQSPLMEEPSDLLKDSIATGFQFEMLQESDPVARAAASVQHKEIDSILRWVPRFKSSPRRSDRQSSGVLIDVFISYSSPDRQSALIICQGLESRGLACWIAPRDIGPGVSYPEAIMQGLRAAKVLVLVFSTHANASPHVEREVERAVSLRTPVLTLRLTDIAPADSLEYLISTSQWQEAENPPQANDVERLAEAVSRLVSG
jgi:hypothetical protein